MGNQKETEKPPVLHGEQAAFLYFEIVEMCLNLSADSIRRKRQKSGESIIQIGDHVVSTH